MIGANSTIARAILSRWRNDPVVDTVFAISRDRLDDVVPGGDDSCKQNMFHAMQCDYMESSIQGCCDQIVQKMKQQGVDDVTRVCICNGVLHNETIWPEKRIEEIDGDKLLKVFSINTVIPVLWLKALLGIVKGRTQCVVTVFNARIGSIGDNRSGGWYSYRASKAALNMLLKSAAIEYARRARNVKLISFHPGTTDTPLTEPFQRNISADNLFSADFVAERLVEIMNRKYSDGELSFIDWEDKSIVW